MTLTLYWRDHNRGGKAIYTSPMFRWAFDTWGVTICQQGDGVDILKTEIHPWHNIEYLEVV